MFSFDTFFGGFTQLHTAANHIIVIAETVLHKQHLIIMNPDSAFIPF